MAILETKHTRARINVIKNDLLKAVTIFSAVSLLAFLVYYIYLFIKNLNKPLYLMVYSVLISTIIVLFLVETLIKENNKLLRHEKRQHTEKKRKLKLITKIFKFAAKFILVGIAISETFISRDITMSTYVNVCSAILLVVQILFEITINQIVKQIDYLRLSVELDIEESGIFKSFLSFMMKEKKLENRAIIAQGGSLHTRAEEKMIAEIKADTKEFEEKGKLKIQHIKSLFSTKHQHARKPKQEN